MALSFPAKDPDSYLDYYVDWSPWLPEGDTISASLWIIPTDLVSELENFWDESTGIWISGGVIYQTYELVNRITTVGGRIQDQTVRIKCKQL